MTNIRRREVKKLILSLVVASGLVGFSNPIHASEVNASFEGYGSCYEVKPICAYGQKAVCMCDQTNYCFWACI